MAQPLAAAPPPPDESTKRLWREDLPREHGFETLTVEGTLPFDLRGVLLRNGPGLFSVFGAPYAHPFEGDGAITAVRFGGDEARGACHVVESAGLVEERRRKRALYNFNAPWLRRLRNALGGKQKNTANTSVVAWQGRVLALMEGARPTELRVTERGVSTVGETDLGGVVGQMFSAHPHRIPSRNALYNFGTVMGKKNALRLYELPDQGAARVVGDVPVRHPMMVHDFVVTDRHAVWFLHPMVVQVARLFTGRVRSLAEMFRWREDVASEIVVVPLDRPSEVTRIEVPHFWVWHFGSAKARSDQELVVDYVHYPDASTFAGVARIGSGETLLTGTPHRATIDLAKKTFRTEQVADVHCDFPRIHPERETGDYRSMWISCDDDRALGLVDLVTGDAFTYPYPAGQHGSEPVPVPKRGPGSGDEHAVWVLVLVYDAARDRSGVHVFDGASFPDAPVATAWFDHRIPVTFHGTWVPS